MRSLDNYFQICQRLQTFMRSSSFRLSTPFFTIRLMGALDKETYNNNKTYNLNLCEWIQFFCTILWIFLVLFFDTRRSPPINVPKVAIMTLSIKFKRGPSDVRVVGVINVIWGCQMICLFTFWPPPIFWYCKSTWNVQKWMIWQIFDVELIWLISYGKVPGESELQDFKNF